MFDSMSKKETWMRGMRYLSRRDKRLGKVIEKIGYIKIQKHRDYFGTLIHSIISQQISGAAADSILKRFEGLYGGRIPTPEEYLSTPKRKLSSSGLSPQKISYITDLSRKVRNGDVELKKFHRLPNEKIVEELVGVRGIGRWTVEMFLMFSLGRTDVLPRDDLGLKKGVKRIYRLRSLPDAKKLDKFEKLWRPYSSIATIYIWRSGTGGI